MADERRPAQATLEETKAMRDLDRVLQPLSLEARGRVLSWAAQRYGMLVRAEGIYVPREER